MENEQQTPSKKHLFNAMLIGAGFVIAFGFVIGFAKGGFGEGGTVDGGLRMAARTIVMFLSVAIAAGLLYRIMKGLGWSKNVQTLILMMFAIASLQAGDTIVEEQPELFLQKAGSGALSGLVVWAGLYWAKKRGWIKSPELTK